MDHNSIPIHNSYWVVPGRFRAGEYPGSIQDDEARKKLRWLLDQGTELILDLSEAGEAGLKPYLQLFHKEANSIPRLVMYKRIPIQDFDRPSKEKMVDILNSIDSALSEGKNIYLHCHGGLGRTGMIVGCYLARHGMPGHQALEMIKNLRKDILDDKQSPETEGQRKMVMEWTKGQ